MRGRRVFVLCTLLATAGVVVADPPESEDDATGWQSTVADVVSRQEERAVRELRLYRMQADYERRRERAHARMPDTMYASPEPRHPQTNEPAFCPVPIDEARPILERLLRERNTTWPNRPLPVRPGSNPASDRGGPDDARHLGGPAADVPWTEPSHSLTSADQLVSPGTVPPPMVPLLPPASDSGHEGVVRVINHSAAPGEVHVHAIDDAGRRYGPATLHIDSGATVHFTSGDLESGGGALLGATGPGEGDWRLEFTSDLMIEALAYVRTSDGLLAAMHDTVPVDAQGHRVPMFHPAGEPDNASLLRLINPSPTPVEVVIQGVDSLGAAGGEVAVSIPAGASRTLSAADLESGGGGLRGSLGAGVGKWRLTVTANQPIVAMNLLRGPDGRLANLSTSPARGTGTHRVSLFPSAADPSGRIGVVRIVNHSPTSGTVRIAASDDTNWRYEPLNLDILPGAAVDLESNDLELGNVDKGLTGSTGAGQGDWRLELASDLDIEVLAYVSATDGSLTAVHDTVPRSGGRHRVAMFGTDQTATSLLRLVNLGEKDAQIAITGVDMNGRSTTEIRIALAAGAVRMLAAEELNLGAAGLAESGDGIGAWRLTVRADGPFEVMNLLVAPDGRLVNLSSAPASVFSTDDGDEETEDGNNVTDEETAEEVFRTLISEAIVQTECTRCHYEGGFADLRGARLLFVKKDDDEDDEAKERRLAQNLQAFEDFLGDVDDGANLILSKITGGDDHGGGDINLPSDDYDNMKRFLELLGGEIRDATIAAIFEDVDMSSDRTVLRRAALIFAGRNPTTEEYASIEENRDPANVRATIRGLMACPEGQPRHRCAFREYLIRTGNDRLFTDREGNLIESHNFVAHSEKEYELREQAAVDGDEHETEWHMWNGGVQYAASRAPLELIAHVVENERPYTEILTAPYVMANPMAAEAYGDETAAFDNPNDVHEFQESQIASYYLDCGDAQIGEAEFGSYVQSPGSCPVDDYPHAGILNSKAFLQRYPTTPTNRNRARSRWTYYHFLGHDVENSQDRTTDADALKDTNNPTRNNVNCTRCHENLDPVAGTFQNYGNEGLYRDQEGGWDALDGHYKDDPGPSVEVDIEASSYAEREEVTTEVQLWEGGILFVEFRNDHWDEETGDRNVRLDRLEVLRVGDDGTEKSVYAVEAETLDPDRARDGCRFTASHLVFEGNSCRVELPFDIPADGTYLVKVMAWQDQSGDEHARLGYGTILYRDGDTWYRDMRDPGFNGEPLPDSHVDNGLQWLAEKIVADDGFAEAAVRFWWPSIVGSEIADPAAERDDGHAAQSRELNRLAKEFREGFGDGSPYDLKDLLVEIVMSKWFRAESLTADASHADLLGDAGAKRLLTPEELARKTEALTGFLWGRYDQPFDSDPFRRAGSALTGGGDYGLLYGGIDSGGITERARDITSTMAGVAKRHAMESSCPIVLREFYLLPKAGEQPLLFDHIDETDSPALEARKDDTITASPSSEPQHSTLSAHLTAGEKTLWLKFANDFSNEETGEDRNLHLDRIVVRNADAEEVWSFEFEHLENHDCGYPGTNPATGRTDRWTLNTDDCWIVVGNDDDPFDVPATGDYEIAIAAWGDLAGENPPMLKSRIYADAEVPDGRGAERIKDQLVVLYERLLGESIVSTSPDVADAYELFVEVWKRKEELDTNRLLDWQVCDYGSDFYYFRDLIDDAVVQYRNDDGPYLAWNQRLIERFVGDTPDEQGVTRTWVVVLAHLLMDYRYLYL